jgi:hypothetical protein
MEVSHGFAGVAATDETAYLWHGDDYLSRPLDMLPTKDEAVWRLTSTPSIHVVAGTERAGSGLLAIAVDGLEERPAERAERGIQAYVETLEDGIRRAVVTDPDGNRITSFEDPGSEDRASPRQPPRGEPFHQAFRDAATGCRAAPARVQSPRRAT